jgi:D-alanyl-D-alanine carboxypeptidase
MTYDAQATFGTRFGFMGTASDVLRVMQAVYEGNLFSHEAHSFMQDILNRLFDVNPANRDVYKALGNKGGSWAGIFTGVWYVQSEDGARTSLAVFYRNLSDDLWAEWAV